MDSSAFHILVIPVCQGLGLGLIAGLASHLTLKWLAALIEFGRETPATPERLIFSQRSEPAWGFANNRRLPSHREDGIWK
ncbi:hypothetical protein SAMN05444166_4980 [Singulisphaera sp. GP187]|uniref:hypothetical protein n=1 Tax=Singulisphaera sp. GP187 TaxID=1882752 RepID=UPI0009298332|nr:hypothetical protein [Singulisphaera sp. GP187]SIO46687.1 hypothetical protein SAMN05444166_4980 [Singulisphaera sp. GP187]